MDIQLHRVIQYFPKHVEENLRNVHSLHLTNECRQILIFVGWNNSLLNSMPGVSAFIWYDWMIGEYFALHARSLFERTLHSMPGVYLNIALHARSFSRLCTPLQQKWRMSMNYWHDNYQWQYKQYSVKKLIFFLR
jgi:hypothetical protein